VTRRPICGSRIVPESPGGDGAVAATRGLRRRRFAGAPKRPNRAKWNRKRPQLWQRGLLSTQRTSKGSLALPRLLAYTLSDPHRGHFILPPCFVEKRPITRLPHFIVTQQAISSVCRPQHADSQFSAYLAEPVEMEEGVGFRRPTKQSLRAAFPVGFRRKRHFSQNSPRRPPGSAHQFTQ
jgi:hypothetical protein